MHNTKKQPYLTVAVAVAVAQIIRVERFKRSLAVGLCIGSLVASNLSHAESQQTRCVNSGILGKSFAETRDQGMPLGTLVSNLEYIGSTTGMSEEDVLRAKVAAGMIYSDMKQFSPGQVQQTFFNRCMKLNAKASSR